MFSETTYPPTPPTAAGTCPSPPPSSSTVPASSGPGTCLLTTPPGWTRTTLAPYSPPSADPAARPPAARPPDGLGWHLLQALCPKPSANPNGDSHWHCSVQATSSPR